MESPAKQISLTTSIEYTAYDHDKPINNCIAMATVRAPLYESHTSNPVDIVAVIDHSGSMAGEKLDLVRKTLLFIIDKLRTCDRFCLILFDDLVTVEVHLTSMTKQNQEIVKSKVKKIKERGGTNLCGGLLKGMEQIVLRNPKEKGRLASVLLFTDGLANCGITSYKEIVAAMNDPVGSLSEPKVFDTHISLPSCFHHLLPLVQEMTDVPEPTNDPNCLVNFEGTIYTFGYGSHHNGNLLTAISNAGGGVYYFIESTEMIIGCFAECLGGLFSIVAQNMKLAIEAQPYCTLGTIHYRNKPQMEPDNKKCLVSLGDLQSEEKRNIVIPTKLVALETECMAQPLIKLTLSYLDVMTGTMHKATTALAVTRKKIANIEPDESVRIQSQRIQVSMALQDAMMTISRSPQHARAVLENSKKYLDSPKNQSPNPALSSDLSDVIKNIEICSPSVSNLMASFQQEISAERRNSSLRHSSENYFTSPRCYMRDNSSLFASMK